MLHQSLLATLVPQFIEGGILTSAEVLHGGLINATYLVVSNGADKLVLQRVNTAVFTKPELVMSNILRVTSHLKSTSPEARNLHLTPSLDGASFILDGDGGLWRAFNYLEDCAGHEQVESTELAYEAGKAFGQFLTQLSDMDASGLSETIPNFHNTPMRLEAFDEALSQDVAGRAHSISADLDLIASYRSWVSVLEELRAAGVLPTRITHNDTKISNVLFDAKTQKAVCVIDLDTVMPGTMLYDFGDLVRTSVNSVSESAPAEEVKCRMDIFEALVKGYLEAAGSALNSAEKQHLVFSAKLITFELALRFLTDYLQGDPYFRISHEKENLERARNQLRLVQILEENETEMEQIVVRYL